MASAKAWLRQSFLALTSESPDASPVEWAEEKRVLTQTNSSRPGKYRYDVTPYLREPANCLDVRSPVRHVTMMKGAQTGGTVGVIENGLGYFIDHVKTAPMMMVTSTQELANIRVDKYITPMLQNSGLADLIQSNDDISRRKSGKTERMIEGYGGWFLMPIGAREAANLRSVSIRVLFRDELDSWPLAVGKDGDPGVLAERRTNGFVLSRKIIDVSTPLLDHESRIKILYELGDQRKWHVPCLGCGEYQELRWSVKDEQTREKIGGVFWEMNGDRLVAGSVRYVCPHCGHKHTNNDKRKMLPEGRWVPTAEAADPTHRSYHISGLMSPADFYSFEHAVRDWIKAWDVEADQVRDRGKLQEFYNGVLGVPFAVGTTKLTYAKVARHCRDYAFETVPRDLAAALCGSSDPMMLTCAVDVQDKFLSVAVFAWGRHRVGFLVEKISLSGDTSDINEGPWRDLRQMLREKRYPDGAGRTYSIAYGVIDSGHNPKLAYSFCQSMADTTMQPIKGASARITGPATEFTKMKNASQVGTIGWNVNVDVYKSRLASLLLDEAADGTTVAPVESVSFPLEIDDSDLKELTAEQLVEETNKHGHRGWVWKRSGRNELWDLTVYNSAARDILAYRICREDLEQETVEWDLFWTFVERSKFGWSEVAPVAPKPAKEV